MTTIKQDLNDIKEIISSMQWQIKVLEHAVKTLEQHKAELETVADIDDFDEIVAEAAKDYKTQYLN